MILELRFAWTVLLLCRTVRHAPVLRIASPANQVALYWASGQQLNVTVLGSCKTLLQTVLLIFILNMTWIPVYVILKPTTRKKMGSVCPAKSGAIYALLMLHTVWSASTCIRWWITLAYISIQVIPCWGLRVIPIRRRWDVYVGVQITLNVCIIVDTTTTNRTAILSVRLGRLIFHFLGRLANPVK